MVRHSNFPYPLSWFFVIIKVVWTSNNSTQKSQKLSGRFYERERERVKSLRDFDLNFTKPFTQSAVFCGAFCLPRSSAEGGYFRVFSKWIWDLNYPNQIYIKSFFIILLFLQLFWLLGGFGQPGQEKKSLVISYSCR